MLSSICTTSWNMSPEGVVVGSAQRKSSVSPTVALMGSRKRSGTVLAGPTFQSNSTVAAVATGASNAASAATTSIVREPLLAVVLWSLPLLPACCCRLLLSWAVCVGLRLL